MKSVYASTLNPSDIEALRNEFDSLKLNKDRSSLSQRKAINNQDKNFENKPRRQDFVNLDSYFDDESKSESKNMKRSRIDALQ